MELKNSGHFYSVVKLCHVVGATTIYETDLEIK